MADAQTMQAYADNMAAFKTLVDSMPSNPHLERFITYLPAGAAVLDFGCGVGNSAALMRDAGFAMTCMDASSDMISAAKELYDLEVLQRNFTDLEDIASFDGIWASYSLLHAPKSDMPDILQRIHAALRASGMVYVGLKRGDAEERDDIGRFYAITPKQPCRHYCRTPDLIFWIRAPMNHAACWAGWTKGCTLWPANVPDDDQYTVCSWRSLRPES